ncbi:MAG: hypothetical protein GEV00_23540, partial [Actinophytocola sp.]|nr:hypothetical protein [Actinophytocola sp.]
MLASLFIMLREGFEAALIVAIIYAYIRKIDRRDLLAPMWSGVAVAVGLVIRLLEIRARELPPSTWTADGT